MADEVEPVDAPEVDEPQAEEPAAEVDDTPAEASTEARRALEAIVMVADQPADAQLLAQLVELSPAVVEATLAALAAEYEEQHRGFRLVKVAGGWRFQSHEDLSPYVERFVLSGQSARLSAAALETLAIVAYKQPISRAQVAAIRGVNVEAVMKTLITRGLVEESGIEHESGAILYKTTSYFLERLGLNSLEDLPALAPYLPNLDGLDEILDSLTD